MESLQAMNVSERNKWIDAVLNEIFSAILESEKLKELLTFKGARILGEYIKSSRKSLDIDCNLNSIVKEKGSMAENLTKLFAEAVKKYLEGRGDDRFHLTKLTVTPRPKRGVAAFG
jgi:hypothetical protein